MFLPREKNILKLLYKNEDTFTTSRMGTQLGVSQRTVKADIKKINGTLSKYGCCIETKAGVGLWLSYDEEGERFLKNILYKQEKASPILPETRKYYVTMKLFENPQYVSMEDISQELFISKGTVVNDINEIEPYLLKYGIKIVRKVKYGLHLQGDVKQIRAAQSAVLKKIVGQQGEGLIEKSQPFFRDINLTALQHILIMVENQFGIVFADVSYFELIIQLAIIINQIKKGFVYKEADELVTDYEKEPEWIMCDFLIAQIEKTFAITLNDVDIKYIMMHLRSVKYQRNKRTIENNYQAIRDTAPEMFDVMMQILESADDMYHVELTSDMNLISILFDHLKSMVKRARDEIYIENPILDAVKNNLMYEYEIASYIADCFSKQYKISLTENEIGYITLYVGTSIEKMIKKNTSRKVSAILVCATGIGTSQFLEAKLGRMFPNLVVEDVIPVSRLETIVPNDRGFIISTVAIYKEGFDIVCVSPVLDENDAKIIQNHIKKILLPEKLDRHNYPYLGRLINKNSTILKCDCKSKEEVIRLMGTRLNGEGYVDEEFIDSVFKREELASTSIGSLFAIPHGFEGHILKTGVGLITLTKPIIWGKEKVQIIFMLAMDSKSQVKFKSIFEEIADMTRDEDAVANLLEAEKFEHLNIFG